MLVTTKGQAVDEGPRWSTIKELVAAAEKGVPLACFQYAQLLETGDQVEKHPGRALEFYRRAAEGNHPGAQFRLGKIHHDGLLGVSVDYSAAIDYYRRAAAGQIPEAMYNIGSMLVSARGVKRDYVAGLAWLIVAAQHGAAADAGVQQVKQRLTRYPKMIAAAEERATGLAEALQAGQVPNLDGTLPAPPAAAVAPPRPEVSAPRPSIELDRPRVTPAPAPSITLEKPKFEPLPPPPGGD